MLATSKRLMNDINLLASTYLDDSEISRLNAAGTNHVAISPLTRELLHATQRYYRASLGAFDPTVAPLVQLWGFNGGHRPEQEPPLPSILRAREAIGFDALQVMDSEAWFNVPGRSLDLGGIAKGFAVDICYHDLTRDHHHPFLLNLGGNIRCYGRPEHGRSWRVGVRNPFNREQTVGVLELKSGMATATSGNYERFVELNGKRYAHIINPNSGYPVQGMAGVTVLSPTATDADAFSTTFFVVGIKKAMQILETRSRTGVLFIPDKQPLEIWVSPYFEKHFTVEPEYTDAVRILWTRHGEH